MTIKLGVVMDSIESINIKKDSTIAMMVAAQARGWEVYYLEQKHLTLKQSGVYAQLKRITIDENEPEWFKFSENTQSPLKMLDVILMRIDPPFNMEYIYTTYLLELVEKEHVLIVNKPQSLRDANEKMFIAQFPQCIPPTLVTRLYDKLNTFLTEHQEIIVKPLDGMGGQSIFYLHENDYNKNVIFETMTNKESQFVMAQKFIPEIRSGDKRILMIDGEPLPYALARIPPQGEVRGNLAVGGKATCVPLTPRDKWICEQLTAVLKEKELMFVGIDVIGDYLTEINVTSPTCIRELDKMYNLNISATLLDVVTQKLTKIIK